MKVVTEEKYIPAKTCTITKYIASDGKEFADEDMCLRYEEQIEVMNHPVFKSRIANLISYDDDYNVTLYYIRDKKDYDFLIKHRPISPEDQVYSDFEKYGEGWYLFWVECADCYNIYNYDAYEKQMESNWKEYKEKMHSLMANKSTIL